MLLGVARRGCCIFALGSVIAAERASGEEHFRAGYQEAAAEAVRFLVEVHGYAGDGHCAQLASHLQRHCELVTKGEIILIIKTIRVPNEKEGAFWLL